MRSRRASASPQGRPSRRAATARTRSASTAAKPKPARVALPRGDDRQAEGLDHPQARDDRRLFLAREEVRRLGRAPGAHQQRDAETGEAEEAEQRDEASEHDRPWVRGGHDDVRGAGLGVGSDLQEGVAVRVARDETCAGDVDELGRTP